MIHNIKEDIRVFKSHHGNSLAIFFYYPMFCATVMLRFSKWLYKHRCKLLSYFVVRLNDFLHGIWVGPQVSIGPGIFLGHARGLIINPGTKIGKNCVILQRVTIGGPNVVIGNNVFIGANAQIISSPKKGKGISIGDNASIGANALIVKDVPAGAFMVAPQAIPLAEVKKRS